MKGKVRFMFIVYAPKTRSRTLLEHHKNSALARPISGLTFIVSTVARDLPVSPSEPLSSVPHAKASLSLLRGGLSSLFILSRKPDCLLVSTKCERGVKSQTSENLTLGELHNAEY